MFALMVVGFERNLAISRFFLEIISDIFVVSSNFSHFCSFFLGVNEKILTE
jgi:hypothetical protein